jgi:hypothetical protein
MNEIFLAVQDACFKPVVAVRSAYAVTLVSEYPFRHIQIVSRLYNSPAGGCHGVASFPLSCRALPPPPHNAPPPHPHHE